ncbi:MAG: 4'-phosphopantetheinyl transferase superfamily protein [Acidimicrobiales bacterium]
MSTGPRPAPDLAALFSDAVAYELTGPDLEAGGDEGLWPEEETLVARAVAARRLQFAAGRRCARAGLLALGLPAGPIPAGPQRAPRWPDGTTGSISHTTGYAVAVVRRTGPGAPGAAGLPGVPAGDPINVGVDAEQLGRVGDHLYSRLFTPGEEAWLGRLPGPARDAAATAVFGAKEAFYKAQFPVTGAWVGFHDVRSSPVQNPDGTHAGYRLEPHTGLAALDAVRWPCLARHVQRGAVVVSAVEVVAAPPR